MKEIALLEHINNLHVLQLFSSWKDSKLKATILVTELMSGGTLKDYGKCSPHVIRNWGRQILQGLDCLHSHKPTAIIHRDLKCKNIFVNKASGIVKIGDLGLATLKSTTGRTKSKNKGTILFKAPEMATGHYNELVDVYSFGMCLLELSTGEYPYQECDNEMHLLTTIVIEKRPPKLLESVADNKLKDIITSCIKSDPKERCSVMELLKLDFFAENKFKVILQQEEGHSAITSMKIQDTQNDHVLDTTVPYDFRCHTSQSITQELIDSGKLAEADRTAVTDALIEKSEVLTLLRSQTYNGTEQTDSGVVMDTGYSTDTSTMTQQETQQLGQIQLDDGARIWHHAAANKQLLYETPPPATNGNQGTSQSTSGTMTTSVTSSISSTTDTHKVEAENGTHQQIQLEDASYSATHQPSIPSTIASNIESEITDSQALFTTNIPPSLKDEESLETLRDSLDLPPSASTSKEYNSMLKYDCWRDNIYKMIPFVESNLSQVATALNVEGLISSSLCDDIQTPRSGLSEREQINHLLNIIQRKLDPVNSAEEIIEKTWKAFNTAIGKTDYKKIKLQLESLVTEQHKSRLEAFKHYKEKLCLLLQSSVLPLTNQLWSSTAINDNERKQVTDSNYHYEQKWMNKMIDEISKQIKEDPAVFDQVGTTFKRVEGLKKVTEKYLTL